jgi:hypothetical protein
LATRLLLSGTGCSGKHPLTFDLLSLHPHLPDQKVSYAMSSKTKVIALSVGALLAIGGGIYAVIPGNDPTQSVNAQGASAQQVAAEPDAPETRQLPVEPSKAKDEGQTSTATVAGSQKQPLPSVQAPKKLTREQLTPPPATEEEKLQQAAERESNF